MIIKKITFFLKKLRKLAGKNKVLLLILFVGLLLRFWGVYPGFPYYHSDEPMVYRNAAKIISEHKFLSDVYAYPTLLPFFHAFLFIFIFIPLTILKTFIVGKNFLEYTTLTTYFNDAVFGYQEINALFWSRYINAFVGSISIFITYYLGKRLYDKKVGLLAASLLAVNFRHVLGSHYSLVDITNGALLLLGFISSLEILKSSTRKTYILAGIISGLSLSVKYNPWSYLMVFIAHLFKLQIKTFNHWFSNLFLLTAVFLLTTITVSPFHFINSREVLKYLEYLQFKYGTGNFYFLPYPYLYLFEIGLGQIISILSIIGILISFKKEFKKTLIIFINLFLFFYSLTVYSSGGIYVRNFVGVIPFLLIFAAVPLSLILNFLVKRWGMLGKVLFSLSFLALIFTPALNSYKVAENYAKAWNLTTAKKELNYLKGKNVAGDNWFLDQIFDPHVINKIDFNINSNFTLPELQEAGAEYLILDTGSTERFFTWWMKLKNKNVLTKNRKQALYKTFSGKVIKELVERRNQEFIKPWQAYETNIFVVPIPKKMDLGKTEINFKESFEERNNESNLFVEVPLANLGKIIKDEKCMLNTCLFVSVDLNQKPSYFIFGNVLLTPKIIKVNEGSFYQVKAKIRSSNGLSNNQKDGVIRVDLYKELNDFNKSESENKVFVSSRYSSRISGWQEKEVIVDIPKEYKYMTVTFQSYNHHGNEFLIDDLVIEKSLEKSFVEVKRKYFPEDVVFINSII